MLHALFIVGLVAFVALGIAASGKVMDWQIRRMIRKMPNPF